MEGRYWHRSKIVYYIIDWLIVYHWFITLMNLQTVLYLIFSQVFLGGWR